MLELGPSVCSYNAIKKRGDGARPEGRAPRE
jgi:hypothetical protein